MQTLVKLMLDRGVTACQVADYMAYLMVTVGVITFGYLLYAGPAPYGRWECR